MDKEKTKKTAFERIEDALKWFWRRESGAKIMKAKNAEFIVEPKIFIGQKINSEIASLIIKRYLSKINLDDILSNKVIVEKDRIIINDDNGKKLLEIKNKKIIDSMKNKITRAVGIKLSEKLNKDGQPLLNPKENDEFNFGDIKESLINFVQEMGKNDSKNLLKDAILLIGCGEDFKHLVSQNESESEKV